METKYFPQLTFNYGTVNRQRRVLLSNGDPDTHNPGLLIFKTAGDKTCGMDAKRMFVPRPQYHPEIFCTYDTKSSRESEVLRLASGHDGNQPWADRLEGENVMALSTTASKDTTAALRAAADKKTVRASALGLGGLVGALHGDVLRGCCWAQHRACSALPVEPRNWGNPRLEQKHPLRSNTCTTNRGCAGAWRAAARLWITVPAGPCGAYNAAAHRRTFPQ